MTANQPAPETIDEYIAGFPTNVQEILEKIRMTIRAAAPDAQETMRYHMPTFTLNGHNVVYFAAFKKHIGLYPAPIGIAEFKEDLAAYESGKGTMKFPLDKPIPFELISRIVTFRARENKSK
jgi:uncharacterized protein YdhG (YjbR/CyaY superfamily)